MAYRYEFVESAECIVVTWSEQLSVKELVAFIEEVAEHAEFRSGLDRLHDFRGVDFDLSAEALKSLAGRVQPIAPQLGKRRVAALVGDDLSYGVMRVFMAVGSSLLADTHVTTNAAEAKTWVGLHSDYVLPADR